MKRWPQLEQIVTACNPFNGGEAQAQRSMKGKLADTSLIARHQ